MIAKNEKTRMKNLVVLRCQDFCIFVFSPPLLIFPTDFLNNQSPVLTHGFGSFSFIHHSLHYIYIYIYIYILYIALYMKFIRTLNRICYIIIYVQRERERDVYIYTYYIIFHIYYLHGIVLIYILLTVGTQSTMQLLNS